MKRYSITTKHEIFVNSNDEAIEKAIKEAKEQRKATANNCTVVRITENQFACLVETEIFNIENNADFIKKMTIEMKIIDNE